MDPKTGRPFRVLVVGPDTVGAKCAVLWLEHDTLILDVFPPPGFEGHACTVEGVPVEVFDGPEVLLDAGNDAFRSDYAALAAEAVGLLALFDVASLRSMADMYTILERTQALRAARGLAPLPFFVIGTNMEPDGRCAVSAADARAAAAVYGGRYAAVNAYTGENVRAAFTDAIMFFIAAADPSVNNNPRHRDGARKKRPRDLRSGCKHQ